MILTNQRDFFTTWQPKSCPLMSINGSFMISKALINDLLTIKLLVTADKVFLIRKWHRLSFCKGVIVKTCTEKSMCTGVSSYFATWSSWNCNFRVSFQWPQRLILWVRRHFKAPGTGWPRHYSTNLFKQLIVRQRRLQHTFCGRYEQTVNDVYLRLTELTTKGVCLGKRKSQQKREIRERTKGRQFNALVI